MSLGGSLCTARPLFPGAPFFRMSQKIIRIHAPACAFALIAWTLACATGCAQWSGTAKPGPLVSALPTEFCYADEVVPLLRTDLKYAGCDNFVGRPIAGYVGKRPILRKDAAAALHRVAQELRPLGYGLIIWDAYRPARAMHDFRMWSRSADVSSRPIFYPRITKEEIYSGHYIGDISEHSWGIAVDISLYHLRDGKLVDMGGRHDLLDPSSATDSTEISPTQRSNRQILCDAMQRAGFENYPKEWWHYRLSNSRPWYSYDFCT